MLSVFLPQRRVTGTPGRRSQDDEFRGQRRLIEFTRGASVLNARAKSTAAPDAEDALDSTLSLCELVGRSLLNHVTVELDSWTPSTLGVLPLGTPIEPFQGGVVARPARDVFAPDRISAVRRRIWSLLRCSAASECEDDENYRWAHRVSPVPSSD